MKDDRYLTKQEKIDNLTMRIETDAVMGSGYIQHPPQVRRDKTSQNPRNVYERHYDYQFGPGDRGHGYRPRGGSFRPRPHFQRPYGHPRPYGHHQRGPPPFRGRPNGFGWSGPRGGGWRGPNPRFGNPSFGRPRPYDGHVNHAPPGFDGQGPMPQSSQAFLDAMNVKMPSKVPPHLSHHQQSQQSSKVNPGTSQPQSQMNGNQVTPDVSEPSPNPMS